MEQENPIQNNFPQKKQLQNSLPQGNFAFNCTGWWFACVSLGVSLGSVLTLGLAGPWLFVWALQWFFSHIAIAGRSLCFKGTGWGYVGTYLTIFIFTLLTLGIYAPWGVVRAWKWAIENTSYEEE